eukprot:m51a1_g9546 putative ras guanine nucleotide exchange factor (619) ;mRNA; f:859604-861913
MQVRPLSPASPRDSGSSWTAGRAMVGAGEGPASYNSPTLGRRPGSFPAPRAAARQQQREPAPTKPRVKPASLVAVPARLLGDPARPLYALNEADRSGWLAQVVEKHPHIADIRERVMPLQRAAAFCRAYNPGGRDVKDKLGHAQIVQLVLQHLNAKGFKETRHALEREAKTKMPRHKLHTSRLVANLRQAVRDADRLYDLVLAEKVRDSKPLEEHLWHIGLADDDEDESQDVDLWQEILPAEKTDIVTEQSSTAAGTVEVVKAGSLNRLVEKLTEESEKDYASTFLITYQSFTTPERLLRKLAQRFDVPAGYKPGDGRAAPAVIRARVVNIVRRWVEEFGQVFSKPELAAQLNEFIDHAVEQFPGAQKSLVRVVPELVEAQMAERRKARAKRSQEEMPEPEPSELLNQSWSKPKLRHRSPNALAMIKRFNHVSSWVATEIVTGPTVRDRARVLAKFLRIGEELVALNNYNSLMAIIAGYNSAATARLKWTLEELPVSAQKAKPALDDLMKSDGNFKNYRARLAATESPSVPYLGVHLTDLTFVDENPDNTNGLINFGKRNFVYNIISNVLQYQNRPYNLQPVHQIIQFLKRVPTKDEQELYTLSLKREPRGAPRTSIV